MRQILLTLACLYLVRSVLAQRASTVTQDRALMQQTTHLFEAEVVSTTVYPNVATNKLVQTSLLHVTRTLKGPPLTGTVRVFYEGPRYSGSGGTPGSYIIDDMGGHGSVGPQLPKQTTILFYTRPLPASYPRNPDAAALVQADQSRALELIGYAPYVPYDSIQSTIGGKFADKQALYRYLATQHRVAISLAEQSRKAPTSGRDTSVHPARRPLPAADKEPSRPPRK